MYDVIHSFSIIKRVPPCQQVFSFHTMIPRPQTMKRRQDQGKSKIISSLQPKAIYISCLAWYTEMWMSPEMSRQAWQPGAEINSSQQTSPGKKS